MKKISKALLLSTFLIFGSYSCSLPTNNTASTKIKANKPENSKMLVGKAVFPASRKQESNFRIKNHGFKTKATASDIGAVSTISVISLGQNLTLATGLTDNLGNFQLDLSKLTLTNNITYVLEASKRTGEDVETIRTYIKWNGTSWESITTGDVVINENTTAISIIATYLNISVLDLISKVDPANLADIYDSTNTNILISSADITNVSKLVTSVLLGERDPIALIKYDVTKPYKYYVNQVYNYNSIATKNGCNGCSFIGADFSTSGASLAGKDLSYADLSGQDLSNQDLSGTILIGADLRNATLPKDLSYLNLSNTNLTGQNLTQMDVKGTNFSNANLTNAILSEEGNPKDLTQARFTGVNFTGASLAGANLSKVYLFETLMENTNIKAANFEKADLTGVNLSNVQGKDLTDVKTKGANLTGTDFTGLDVTKLDFKETKLVNANFTKANLTGLDFSNFNIENCNFSEANLKSIILKNVRIKNGTMYKVNLDSVDLSYLDLSGIDFSEAKFMNAHLSGTKFIGSDLNKADFTGLKNYIEDLPNDYSNSDMRGVILPIFDCDANLLKNNNNTIDYYNAIQPIIDELKYKKALIGIFDHTNFEDTDLSNSIAANSFNSAINIYISIKDPHSYSFSDKTSANFNNANFKKTILKNSIIKRGYFTNANFEDTDLTNTNMSSSNLFNSKIKLSIMNNTSFDDSKWYDGHFCDPNSIDKCKYIEKNQPVITYSPHILTTCTTGVDQDGTAVDLGCTQEATAYIENETCTSRNYSVDEKNAYGFMGTYYYRDFNISANLYDWYTQSPFSIATYSSGKEGPATTPYTSDYCKDYKLLHAGELIGITFIIGN